MHSNTNEDSEKVNRSNTDNENIYTGNALMHTNDHQHVPNNKGITTCDNDLNPPIIAIGTHKDQCKVYYILTLSNNRNNSLKKI